VIGLHTSLRQYGQWQAQLERFALWVGSKLLGLAQARVALRARLHEQRFARDALMSLE
jgi:hypothetical protein